jgi:ribonuclease BN (tRNA processing enzyme)
LITRRAALAAAIAAAAARPAAADEPPPGPSFGLGPDRLILLGTKGGPAVRGDAAMPSSQLLIWNNTPYLIDAGYGTTLRLVEAHFPLPQLRTLFITHNHSDHNLEAAILPYNAWAVGLKTPVDIYGPDGIEAVVSHGLEANRFDIETRIADEGRPDLFGLVHAHRYAEGPVFTGGGVTVTALRNEHPPIHDSFALKFDFGGFKIVFSGDTHYFPPLAAFANGADVLVHEVAYEPALRRLAARSPNADTLLSHLRNAHTMAEDVGRVAAAAGVKTLVLSHLTPGDDPAITPADWIGAVRGGGYAGTIILGHDLLEIRLPQN